MDFTPAETRATGHLVNSGRSADISRASEERKGLSLGNVNGQLTVLTRMVNTSQAGNIRTVSVIYAFLLRQIIYPPVAKTYRMSAPNLFRRV